MRKRKWLVPVCAALFFALAAALLLLLPGSPQLPLYDYARSLPDDSYYVDRDGVVWQLSRSDTDRRYIKRTEGLSLRESENDLIERCCCRISNSENEKKMSSRA